jgi:hypothetical protein
MSLHVQVFGCRQQGGCARSTGRRPKSAKARSRGKFGTGWAAGVGADLDGGRDAGRM